MRDTEVTNLTKQSKARHSSRCRVCLHPERAAIERSFIRRTHTVADICMKYNIGRDSLYRHSDALKLIEPRNRNWRAPVIPDNSVQATTEAVETGKTVLPVEKEATPYARMMLKLLNIPEDDQLLAIVERAVEAKAAAEDTGIDLAANALFNLAALQKIQRAPDDWLSWFGSNVNGAARSRISKRPWSMLGLFDTDPARS